MSKLALVLAALVFSIQSKAFVSAVPIGHIESAMGNTGVGATNTPSSVFYNPGGISSVETQTVTASGSSYYLLNWTPPAGSGAPNVNSLNSVPTTMISTWKIGEGVLGASLLVPESVNYALSGNSPSTSADLPNGLDYELNTTSTRSLVGLSWGRPVHRSEERGIVRLGATLFFSHHVAQTSGFFATPTAGANALILGTASKATTMSLNPVVGVLFEPMTNLSYGLRVSLPSILISAENTGKSHTVLYGTFNGSATQQQVRAESSGGWPTLPSWGVSGGASWKPNDRWHYVADLSVEERHLSVNGSAAGDAPIDASFGARNFFGDGWSWLAGTRFFLDQVFDKREPTEGKILGWVPTGGVSWMTKDLETVASAFYYKSFKLEDPAQPATGTSTDVGSLNYYGLTLSAMYRF